MIDLRTRSPTPSSQSSSDSASFTLDEMGRVASWSPAAERLTGHARAWAVGLPFRFLFTGDEQAEDLPERALARALVDGRFERELWIECRDGARRWMSVKIDPVHDQAGRHTGFVQSLGDITAHRAAEDALADRERQFRLLVESVVDYALYMLDARGRVTNWNAGAEHIKGYRTDEIVGEHFSRFYTEADRTRGLPDIALRTAAECGRYEAEGWRVRKDGSLFWANAVIDAIRDANGEVVGFAKITRDITERRNAELELQRAQAQLAQAQKLEALGRLTGGVAHDFNNLLMVVSGQAQLLRRLAGDEARALRALDAIEAASARGEGLTRRLLAFSRRQRLEPAPVALDERAEGLRALVAASLTPGIALDLQIPEGLWPVEVDFGELELSLLNLAVNARDAIAGDGRITLSAENIVLDGQGPPELSGEYVALTVADTGAGMPADILARIFEPFFTTKGPDRGTGLGLSQVYGFAQQSGGAVTADSEMGAGSRFTLYLPRARATPSRAEVEGEAQGVGRGRRILLVEDNPEVAEVAAGLLEHLGHSVRLAGDAATALSALAEGERPDLVFSDVVMSGPMDGVALARTLRRQDPDLPILLATGYSDALVSLGDEFPILRKPYRLADLGRAVEAAFVAR